MALTYNGTQVGLPQVHQPAGYVKPVVSNVTPNWSKKSHVFTVTKSAVENADPVVTLDAIIATLDINVEAYLDSVFDDTTVSTAHGTLTSIKTNAANAGDPDFYTDAVIVYKCTVDIYVNTQA